MAVNISWRNYKVKGIYDELIRVAGKPRESALPLTRYLSSLGKQELADVQRASELAIKEMGVTFTVYTDGSAIDREWPLDIIPRVMTATEWSRIEAGLKQRVQALNLFIEIGRAHV